MLWPQPTCVEEISRAGLGDRLEKFSQFVCQELKCHPTLGLSYH